MTQSPTAPAGTTDPAVGAEGTEPTTEPTTTEPTGIDGEVEKWKALARKHEKDAKANADAAKKLAEIEEANKSEAQKLLDASTAKDTRIAELEAELVRERVARRHNLTDDQAKRLIGVTEEELEADAQELVKILRVEPGDGEEEPPAPQVTTQPKPKLRSGSAPATPLNDDKLLAGIKSKLGVK